MPKKTCIFLLILAITACSYVMSQETSKKPPLSEVFNPPIDAPEELVHIACHIRYCTTPSQKEYDSFASILTGNYPKNIPTDGRQQKFDPAKYLIAYPSDKKPVVEVNRYVEKIFQYAEYKNNKFKTMTREEYTQKQEQKFNDKRKSAFLSLLKGATMLTGSYLVFYNNRLPVVEPFAYLLSCYYITKSIVPLYLTYNAWSKKNKNFETLKNNTANTFERLKKLKNI